MSKSSKERRKAQRAAKFGAPANNNKGREAPSAAEAGEALLALARQAAALPPAAAPALATLGERCGAAPAVRAARADAQRRSARRRADALALELAARAASETREALRAERAAAEEAEAEARPRPFRAMVRDNVAAPRPPRMTAAEAAAASEARREAEEAAERREREAAEAAAGLVAARERLRLQRRAWAALEGIRAPRAAQAAARAALEAELLAIVRLIGAGAPNALGLSGRERAVCEAHGVLTPRAKRKARTTRREIVAVVAEATTTRPRKRA